jgi:hypothetical protein
MTEIECQTCKKTFLNKYTLKTHQTKCCKNSHYECEVCFQSFIKEGNFKRHQCRQIRNIQSRYEILEEKIRMLEQQNQTLQEERNRLVELLASRETTIVNNITNSNNNVVTFNTYFSNEVPVVTQNDIDNCLEHLSNDYLLQGPIGIAKFLCYHPYKEKFITTDKSRKIIMHNTEYKNLYKDEKCKWMIYNFLKTHSDLIVQKCTELLSEEDCGNDLDRLNTQVTQNILLSQTVKVAQHAKRGNPSDYDEVMALFITEQGLCNKQVLEHRYSSS